MVETGGADSRHAGLSSAAMLASLLLAGGCATGGGSGSGAAASAEPGYGPGPVSVTPQRDWSDSIIYFVLVDRFADGDTSNNTGVDRSNPGGWHGGDLKGLADHLDEIADLGATAIWINPIQLQVGPVFAMGPPETGTQDGFQHTGFHGYWMDDFNAMESRFGSEDDLRALVEAAHARGIKILLDVVYNHSGYSARYETQPQFKGWIRRRPVDCAADALTCQVGGLPDFDTERDDVREYLLEANIGLAERTGLDGFRLDTVKHINHEFWQLHRDRTRERLGDDFFLLAEVWGGSAKVLDDWFVNDEMDAGFDFTFRGSCRGFMEGKGRTIAFSAYLERRHRVRDGYHLAHYMSSHDEPMALYEFGYDKERFKLCVTLQMATLGIPVIYYGEEVARGGSVWPSNRKPMPWGSRKIQPGAGVERDEDMRAWYKQMIALRRAHPAMSRGDYTRVSVDGDLLVFLKTDPQSDDAVLIAVNRGTEAESRDIERPERLSGGPVTEAVTGESMPGEGATMSISVPPRSVRVYHR